MKQLQMAAPNDSGGLRQSFTSQPRSLTENADAPVIQRRQISFPTESEPEYLMLIRAAGRLLYRRDTIAGGGSLGHLYGPKHTTLYRRWVSNAGNKAPHA